MVTFHHHKGDLGRMAGSVVDPSLFFGGFALGVRSGVSLWGFALGVRSGVSLWGFALGVIKILKFKS